MKKNNKRLRLSVFRSNKYIYGQVIDDKRGITLVEANSKSLKTKETEEVGKLLAKKAIKKGIKTVWFDRGKYKYHGKVKALAEGAREGGLNF